MLGAGVNNPLHEIETECLVVGGGPAGYGAAVAALAGGARTWIADRHGYLGGMGTAAGLSCYLNHAHERTDLAGAVYRRFVRSQAALGCHYYDSLSQADFFEPESCKRTMETDILEAGGGVLYHSVLSEVERRGDEWVATFVSKGARTAVRCRYLIDATGDGDACALAGARMTHGRRSDGKTQPMSMVVQLGGFDPRAWHASGRRLVEGRYAIEGDQFTEEIARARAAGEWTIPRGEIAMFWSMPTDPTRVTINGTRINGLSACNPLETSRAEVEGRRQARELLEFFRRHVPGFANAYLLQTGPQIGVRESRRIVGRATLDEAQVRARALPASSVVLCAYPIDVHSPEGVGTQFEKTGRGHVYGIPWECQLPEGLENIVAAGRCISATHEAAGSFRVMPTCMGLGEAAGVAITLAHREGLPLHAVRGEDIRATIGVARRETGAPPFDEVFVFDPSGAATSDALAGAASSG